MAITEASLLAGARAPLWIYKPSATAEGAGTWQSLWKTAGVPAAGANPPAYTAGSGYVPTRATTGALGQANAQSGNELRCLGLGLVAATAGTIVIYDRLWACSGFTTNITTLQSVTTPGSLTAGRLVDGSADYSDVELFLEVYGAPGASTATWTITYLDGAGASRTGTYTHPANAESVGQMMPLTAFPATHTQGVQQLTSFQASVTSGSAGDIGVTLLRRIATISPSTVNSEAFKGSLDLYLNRVRDDACLAVMVNCSTTSTGIVQANLGLSDVTP